MNDRRFSGVLLVLIGGYGLLGYLIDVPPFSDPLGPRFLPLVLFTVLTALMLIEFCNPKQAAPAGQQKSTAPSRLFGIFVLYLITWKLLGFLLSTTLCLYLTARQFRCSWMQALMVALIVAVGSYGLFRFLLNIPLPLGEIYMFTRG